MFLEDCPMFGMIWTDLWNSVIFRVKGKVYGLGPIGTFGLISAISVLVVDKQ